MPENEAALIRRAKEDPEAFGVLYERYVDKIYNYIYYRTGNVHDAEDLTSRVFFRALRNLERYEDQGVPFSAWLYRIAHNLVASWLPGAAAMPAPRASRNRTMKNARCVTAFSNWVESVSNCWC
jgi:RNA polymerase sigma factor (sigma-70 family)